MEGASAREQGVRTHAVAERDRGHRLDDAVLPQGADHLVEADVGLVGREERERHLNAAHGGGERACQRGEAWADGGAGGGCPTAVGEWERARLTLASELQLHLLAGLVDARQLADRAHHLPVELARRKVLGIDARLRGTERAE